MSLIGNPLGATACGAPFQPTFDQCISNAFYNIAGRTFTSVETSCASKEALSQEVYYGCLCTQSKAITACYVNSCLADSTFITAQNQETSYCQAAASLVPTNSAVVPTNTGTAPSVALTTGAAQTTSSASFSAGSGPVLALPQPSSISGAVVGTVSASASGAVKSMTGALVVVLVTMLL
ncbi:hypothetical protein HDU98_003823 [Podochytrium sp. JEL0797]|nr:hypothetical protein HDU98_003823 [Podochytrium sp. JEL0797]